MPTRRRSLPRHGGQESPRSAPGARPRPPGGGHVQGRPRGLRRSRTDVRRRAPGDGRGRRHRRRRPGRRAGTAVRAAIDAAVLATGADGPYLVVNADLPCVTPRDLLTLAGADPRARARARPGSRRDDERPRLSPRQTSSLPLYGPGSSARFAGLGPSRDVDAPNLIDDVDTVADLERLGARLGPCTRSVLASLRLGAAA